MTNGHLGFYIPMFISLLYRVSKKFGYHGFLYFTRKLLILQVWFKLLVIRNDFNSPVHEKQISVTIFYQTKNFDNGVRSGLIPVALAATSHITHSQKLHSLFYFYFDYMHLNTFEQFLLCSTSH